MTTGAKNLSAVYRDLDYKLERLRRNRGEDFFEDTPDIRTVQRIIKSDINRLAPEVVVAKLPSHVWRLRHDYEEIKQLAKGGIEAERQAPTEDDLAKISGAGKEKAKPGEMAGAASSQYPESKHPLQVMIGRDVLALAATFKDNLSKIDVLDDAVFQLLGAPWLLYDRPEAESVLHVSHYPEIKVVLAVEHNQPSQFLLLTEQLEPISPGFLKKFREWERQSLTPFIRKCQEMVREIWYTSRRRTSLEMSADVGYGQLVNVPLFVYEFALEHYAESNPSQPEVDVSQVDPGRFPGWPPHYWQLTCPDKPDLLLAAGFGQVRVFDESTGQFMGVMNVTDACRLVTIQLCQLYAQDDGIREIVRGQEALKKQIEAKIDELKKQVERVTSVRVEEVFPPHAGGEPFSALLCPFAKLAGVNLLLKTGMILYNIYKGIRGHGNERRTMSMARVF